MHASIWRFAGDPDDLARRYDRLVAELPAELMRLHLCDCTYACAHDKRRGHEPGAATFAAMDPSETPGTRVSVDMCELNRELRGRSRS